MPACSLGWQCDNRVISTGWAKKTGPFLIDDNFAALNGRKACDMSKVCKCCLEKSIKRACLCVLIFFANLHKYSVSLKLC